MDKTELSERLKRAQLDLPYTSVDLPAIGGRIKAVAEHFQVEELLPYAPCGQGEHLFVTLRRTGWNTADVAAELAKTFAMKTMDVGWGGRKDKQAVATQTFSLYLPRLTDPARIENLLAGLPFEVLDARRHGNKLKTGHVAANRFRILLSEINPDQLEKAGHIVARILEKGLANYYGMQRFGLDMRNLDRAAEVLTAGRKVHGRPNAFIISALQGALFNAWLLKRIELGFFERMIAGDVAQKTDTGGMFVVEDVDEAQERFNTGEIVYTGPVYGHKMKTAQALAADIENDVLESHALTLNAFKTLRAAGSRRCAILRAADLDDFRVEPDPRGLIFSFTLPAGSYATVVMREFTRSSS